MKIFKGQKTKPQNRIRNFYIMRYWGIGIVLLCIPFIPWEVPAFHAIFKSRYWLLADILFLWSVGELFEHSLMQAILMDAQEQKEGKDALNASSLLFFATPLLFLFNSLSLVHLYAMWYCWPEHGMPDVSERLQCAALMIGFFFYVYGRFLPVFGYNSKWGFRTKKASESAETWIFEHKKYGKRLILGGILLLLPCLFLSGIASLILSAIGAIILLLSIYIF